jgi:hypothetical protein
MQAQEEKEGRGREIKLVLACDGCVPVDGVGSEALRKMRNNTWILPVPVTLSNSGVL